MLLLCRIDEHTVSLINSNKLLLNSNLHKTPLSRYSPLILSINYERFLFDDASSTCNFTSKPISFTWVVEEDIDF